MSDLTTDTQSESTDDELLAALKRQLEWDCNETSNHNCKIVTELKENSHGPHLRVWPKTNDRGEYIKVTGWDSVLRSVYAFERKHDEIIVSMAHPDKGLLVRQRNLNYEVL